MSVFLEENSKLLAYEAAAIKRKVTRTKKDVNGSDFSE